MHDVKFSIGRAARSEGVVMTDWLLEFALVGLSLEDRAKGREIDVGGLEHLREEYHERPPGFH